MNSYLKEIADNCGIQKELTFHTARHTFATTITLNNNVPIESVSKMLGHKSVISMEHYAKATAPANLPGNYPFDHFIYSTAQNFK